jgi:hypothetical protein
VARRGRGWGGGAGKCAQGGEQCESKRGSFWVTPSSHLCAAREVGRLQECILVSSEVLPQMRRGGDAWG